MTDRPTFVPSPRLAEAAAWAAEMHGSQTRKATGIPYVAHLYAVAAIAMEHGADEDQTVAALLHDVIEDTDATFDQVRERFGEKVARIVLACSDTDEDPKPPWRDRKERYIAHLAEMDADGLIVTMADKLHNARSIEWDLRVHGLGMFERFTTTDPEQQLWYYGELVKAYRERQGDRPGLERLVDDLAATVAAMNREVEARS